MTVALAPTDISQAFWAMSEHFKELLDTGGLAPNMPGVLSWEVHLRPAHEIVTFENTIDNQVSASWLTVDPDTRDLRFNEVRFQPIAFDFIFAKVLPA